MFDNSITFLFFWRLKSNPFQIVDLEVDTSHVKDFASQKKEKDERNLILMLRRYSLILETSWEKKNKGKRKVYIKNHHIYLKR